MQIYSGERAQSLKVLRIGEVSGGRARGRLLEGWKNDGHVYARVN